jgi:small-conductance mechanosensitive channel
MELTLKFIGRHWEALLLPFTVMLTTILVGWAVRNTAFRSLRNWAARSKSMLDDIAVEALRTPVMIWIVMLAVHLGAQTSRLPLHIQDEVARILLILFITSMTLVFSRLAGVLIRRYVGAASYTSLMENLARVAVVLLGALIVLDTLGISVWPIVTALGVGGVAVALALQDTLSNLFGGFYVSVAGQVRIGDYIKLDSGEEGFIADISWRSTSIRSLQNNVIIVPNAKLAKATVTNYDLPVQSMSVSIAVSVECGSDIDRVENVLLDVTRNSVGQVPGLLSDPPPAVRFIPGFGPSSLDLTLTCYVQKFADQYLVQHELRKRILKRFRLESIGMPFPTRTVYMTDKSQK